MKWLGHGWYSEPGPGTVVLVNGARLCTERTLRALETKGLVELASQSSAPLAGRWRATSAGRELTKELGL